MSEDEESIVVVVVVAEEVREVLENQDGQCPPTL
jgi:hypothetical protein